MWYINEILATGRVTIAIYTCSLDVSYPSVVPLVTCCAIGVRSAPPFSSVADFSLHHCLLQEKPELYVLE